MELSNKMMFENKLDMTIASSVHNLRPQNIPIGNVIICKKDRSCVLSEKNLHLGGQIL